MDHTHIVKRKGHTEEYDERKVYASSYAAVLNVHETQKVAEDIAGKVSKDISIWIGDNKEVSSNQIFQEVTKSLAKYNKDASFMYNTHRDVS
ncbi:hypothetical protein IID23_04460 [Patescibacteria group bacterium]|nr:hypothetical protein [Patescibacteria group bacterium]